MRAKSSAVLIVVSDVPRYFGRYALLTKIGCMGLFIQAVFPIRGWFSRSRRQSVAVAVMIGFGHVSDAGVYPPSTAMKTGDKLRRMREATRVRDGRETPAWNCCKGIVPCLISVRIPVPGSKGGWWIGLGGRGCIGCTLCF